MKLNGKGITIILLAGGVGNRFKSKTNKQLIEINGKTLLEICIENFSKHLKNINIQIVINKSNLNFIKNIANKYKLLKPVIGGITRQQSVFKGLISLKNYNNEYVLVHDTARPIVTFEVLEQLLDFTKKQVNCVAPVIPINDAVRVIKDDKINKVLNKENQILVQTPQLCNFKELLSAHNITDIEYEDETSIFLSVGKKNIHSIKGDPMSLKITRKHDLNLIYPHLIKNTYNYITKIGIGFDIHRTDLIKNKHTDNYIILGGVKITNSAPLIGHSDADVLLHAITDSLLGPINEGDIGMLFPPSDKKWKNHNSSYFLKETCLLLKKHKAKINNIDAVIICEQPKILNYSKEMICNISNILEINPSKISIKGKTSESIGFIGRQEGIAAMVNSSIQVIENISDD
ncbi:2-C-methyl-D-erythritol 2,4-cyclodiphosphate synthase [Alphaproteobacteria bacterium]|nr:2-C-methyl-D-erythritol 2,4-cyclodiphosphate synthase [Alphaproteobacteria bacterium]